MNTPVSLDTLCPGMRACLVEVRGEPYLKERLFDLGFTKNASIHVLFESPSGDPTAYLIKGAVVALRREISQNILVKEQVHGSGCQENNCPSRQP